VNLVFDQKELPVKNPIMNLSITVVAKFLLTILALALPIPAGLFLPVFTLGAVMGRLIGEILKATIWTEIIPAYYAVVCAASLSAGVTRALSTVVVVFELTGQLSLLLPVIISILVAAGVGNLFNEDIYQRILVIRGLPLPLPEIHKEQNVKLLAQDIMKPADFITVQDSVEDIQYVLSKSNHSFYPLVDNATHRALVGVTRRKDLVQIFGDLVTSTENEAAIDMRMSTPDSPVRMSEVYSTASAITTSNTSSAATLRRIQVGSYDAPLGFDTKISVMSSNTMKEYQIPYDSSPLTITVFTPYTKIHFLFSMLRLGVLWVTIDGKLCGVVTKKDLMPDELAHVH
jgi:chloride channel 2